MSNLIKSTNKLRILLLTIFIISAVFASACGKNDLPRNTAVPTAAATVSPVITESPTPEPEKNYSAQFSEPRIIGSSLGIFSGQILSESSVADIGFAFFSTDGGLLFELPGVLFEDYYYLSTNSLCENTTFNLSMYYTEDGQKKYTENQLTFSTPEKIYTDEEVESILLKAAGNEKFDEGSSKAIMAATQGALNLLDIPCGNPGIRCYSLQVNQIKLEYSFNSLGRYTEWDKIDGNCDEETVEIIKDIISVNETLEYADLFCEFVPTPTPLYAYNKYDEEGGQFDAEQFLYDNLVNEEQAYQSYCEYPYIYESPEFQEKYSVIIAENEGNDELSVDINEAVAENKFMFSLYNREYMDKYAIPPERIISLLYAGELSLRPAVAFCYLCTEVPAGYGRLYISTAYRTYETQSSFYTKGAGMKNVENYGDYWHLFRQTNSYVPGFSNHQYGISIDFNDINTFQYDPLYEYLKENADRYGFYNYFWEPWHWTYLGE